MSAPYNDLQSKLEAAVKGVIDAANLGTTVHTGIDDTNIALPAVIVMSESGEEQPLHTGNYLMPVTVRCRSNADDTTLAAHRAFAASVFDAIKTDTFATDLNALGLDFTAMGINQARVKQTRQDRSWLSEMEINVYCAPSVLTP